MQANLSQLNSSLGIIQGQIRKMQCPLPQCSSSEQLTTAIDQLKGSLSLEGDELLQQLASYSEALSDWGKQTTAQDALASKIALNQRLEFRIKKGATQIVVIPVATVGVKELQLHSVAIPSRGPVWDQESRVVQLMVDGHAINLSQGNSCVIGTTSYRLSVESIDRNWLVYHSTHLILTPDNDQTGSYESQTRPCWENQSIARAAATVAR
jgi:hypothetical protein